MPFPAVTRLTARIGLLVVSGLVLLGCLCALPAVSHASVTGTPPGPSHANSQDGEGAHLASCEAMTPKPTAPLGPGAGTLVIAWLAPVVVVARDPGSVPTGPSRCPLFLLHASLRI